MGDRYHKKMVKAVDTESIGASGVFESEPINVYDYGYAGLLVDIDDQGDATGDLKVEIQISPDQGNNWYTLDDVLAEGSLMPDEFPAKMAFSGISLPGAYARVRVEGASDVNNEYLVTVYFMGQP